MTNATLKTLIRAAYGLQNDQVIGGPKWLDADHYDIEAKTAGPISEAEDQPLMQSLLADRFALRVHRETREMTVYVLVTAKGGPKLKQSKGVSNSIHTNRGIGQARIAVTGISLDQFAGMLAKQMGRGVVNGTGLHGRYDFALEWDPDETPGSTVPSVFAAVQEQLGLRLETRKGAVDVLVIDSAEQASAN